MWHCFTSINSNVSNFFSAIMVIHVTSSSFLFLPFLFLFFFLVLLSLNCFSFHFVKWDYGENILKAQCDFLPSNGNQEHYSLNSVSSSIDMWQPHVHPNPSSPWSLYSSHLYKRQQARDNNPGVSVNEQQCLMSNCKLHAHVIRNTNKRKRDFGKHAETFFCEWVGVHMNKSAGKLTTHYCMYVWIYCCFQVQWQSQINRSLSHVSEEILRKAHYIHVLYGKFTWSWILTSSRWTQWVVLTNVHWNHWRCNNYTAMSGRCLQEFLTCYLNSQSV